MRFSAENVADGEMGYSGTGMVNLALADSFAIRATGYYRDQGGFIDSIGTAGSDARKTSTARRAMAAACPHCLRRATSSRRE